MKKVVIILSISFLNFCSLSQKSMRVAELPHVAVDYELLGDTSAEERRVSVFFVDWGHLFSDQQAATDAVGVGSFFSGLEGNAKSGALYKGLQKIPEADKLVEPRWQVETFNIGIFKSVSVQMWAKAIKYTRSAPITLPAGRPAAAEAAPKRR